MIQLTEQELQELMMNLYNRKDSFNTLLEVREYINNETSKVNNTSCSKELNEKQHREILEEFAEEYNYPHNSKVDCIREEDIDSYLKDKSIL
tara:strand:- start:42334 stop:42609 length:276 start_codon:yes stop_codon:yes gene_type:complete